jgi:hypothetical protein
VEEQPSIPWVAFLFGMVVSHSSMAKVIAPDPEKRNCYSGKAIDDWDVETFQAKRRQIERSDTLSETRNQLSESKY